jgi:hypothetical protein
MTRRDVGKPAFSLRKKTLRENTCTIASGDYSTPVSQRKKRKNAPNSAAKHEKPLLPGVRHEKSSSTLCSGLNNGLDFLISTDWTPEQAWAVVELLDDLQDRILSHYLVPIQDLLREEPGMTGDLQEALRTGMTWTFKERLFWTKQRTVTDPFFVE